MLDLASNAGSPAVPLGKAIPNARVVATDLSPASVSLISEYAASEGVTNLTAQPADAQHLQDFGDNTFDAVTCSYGLMFMPDHQKALQEAHRVLKLGGLYVATVWGPLEHYQFGQVRSGILTWQYTNVYPHCLCLCAQLFAALCCAVLCCAVLCCAVLRCAVLCCAVLCHWNDGDIPRAKD